MSIANSVDLRLIDIRKSYGAVPAVRGVSLDVPAGTMLSLIGPSGCGKTTTLRVVAGLERPDSGQIHTGDRLLTDGSTVTPPEARDMGMVFQSYALWPHMSVGENIAFGLQCRKLQKAQISEKVKEVLAIVGMAKFVDRYPGQLSGGQQQRVALARAIATEPRTLLFDEPLSNLDAVLREQMRFEIRSLQQRLGITAVYVTHSQDEALALSDQIAVMQDGSVAQLGAPLDIYNRPRTEFVATFIGLANILEVSGVEVRGSVLTGKLPNGDLLHAQASAAATSSAQATARAKVSIRPVDITIVKDGAPAAGKTQLKGTVDVVAFTGGLVDYFVRLRGESGLRLRVQSTPPVKAAVGDAVTLGFEPASAVALES